MHRSLSLLSLVLLFPLGLFANSPDDAMTRHVRVPLLERPAHATCGGDLDAPLDIAIDAIVPGGRTGGFVQVFGTVTPRKDVEALRLRFESEGAAVIFNRTPYRVGNAAAGVGVDFSLLARFGPGERGAIHVWAESDVQDDAYSWSKRETLYAVIHRNRLYTGMGDYQRIKVQAVEDDAAAGLVTAVEAKEAVSALARVDAIQDARPFVRGQFTAAEEQLNAMVGANTRGNGPRQQADDHHPADRILVRGNVLWTDENGATHPVFGASVSIRDDDTIGFETVAVVGTDLNGNYEAIIDNDDGIGAGDRDIYVVVRSVNNLVNTRTSGGDTYTMQSAIRNETPNGATITENFTAVGNNGSAFSVFQAGTWIATYARSRNGGSIGSVDIAWPNGGTGSFYDGVIQIEQADRWDWDTIHHEYGHYIMDVLNIEDNPGGPHNITDCHSVIRGSKDEGLRLAWGEGWPTFFGTAGQQVQNMAALNVPRVGDNGYDDLEDGSVSYNLEAQSSGGSGEDNELAVQRLLWDLFDNANDGRDTISRSDQTMWTAIDGADPRTLSGGWGALRAGQSNANNLLMGEIASDHAIGPTLSAPADGATVTPAAANFSWTANVGCSNTFAGNSFDLVFYNPSTSAPILTIPGLTTTSATLTAGQIATLTATGHQVLWAVEGRNTMSPATGSYLGENRQITVNRPPDANAGADQTKECTSAGTTGVQLNGTGSSDPDGDTLTYSWTATGITFNNPASSTPTGQFPIGTTVVTLTVSDGIQQDTDTVSVTVRDTTAPVISCPIDITAECTGNLGVQASDPQLAAFFAGASAVDTCDSTPTITHNAPSFFPVGTTTVTFTATDDHGNTSTCQAKVKVVDTTAPVVTASVTPTSLWPPNHKMVTITATVAVTDQCDPNPTWVLTSITSNEPDNGLGDGDAPNDVQGAAYGTADTSFEVRAERGGVGTGRTYTITFTGSDSSGNNTNAVATVTVPKSK